MGKLRFVILGLLSAVLLGAAPSIASAAPAAAAAAPSTGALTAPVTGTFTDALGGTGTFSGTATVTRFARQGSQLVANGSVAGTLTDSVGTVLGTVTAPFQAPVAAADPSCTILHLTLGPLDLNLLGLMVHLDRVVLDITAVSGPGNLLGNLLCAIANLLNGGGPLSSIAGLLNNILRILGA